MSTTHTHEYTPDTRPGWISGYVCKICGFRIPANLKQAAANQGAKFTTAGKVTP